MNERYQKLNTYYKTGIWTLGIAIIVIIPLIPLFFFDMFDIPLGILLGAIFSATFYFLIGYNQRDKYSRKALNIDIFLIINMGVNIIIILAYFFIIFTIYFIVIFTLLIIIFFC